MKFRTRDLWRDHVVRPVTVLTVRVRFFLRRYRPDELRMERMFERRILVAAQALDGFNLRFVGNIVGVKACVACNAHEFPVRRLVENRFIDEERDFLAGFLSGEGFVAMTGKTILA